MVFSSLTFLSIFLPVVFILYQIIPGIRLKNIWLLITSLVFYAYGEPICVFLLIISAFLNYVFGRILSRNKKRSILTLAVIYNLGILFIFKYASFLIGQLSVLTGVSFSVPNIPFPIGISFFTFQAMSYVIDVYREDTPAQKDFLKVILYISLFPQLVAGPIVRYKDVEKELESRQASVADVASGFQRFSIGLAKKVLIANTMGAMVDPLFQADWADIHILSAWIGAIAYMLQIYFDFSGYSDMAIGMGRMFGFHFLENFNYPYISESIQEFWRRWHISLSSWFKEYLYIPLGGNRKGFSRTLWNRFFVFICTGIWHGANWTFLIWGIYHGFFLTMEALIKRKTDRNTSENGSGKRILRHLYALIVICAGFVIFRADTLAQAGFWIRQMFFGFHFEQNCMSLTARMLTPTHITGLALGILGSCPIIKKAPQGNAALYFSYVFSLALLLFSVVHLASGTFNPFIYFQF